MMTWKISGWVLIVSFIWLLARILGHFDEILDHMVMVFLRIWQPLIVTLVAAVVWILADLKINKD